MEPSKRTEPLLDLSTVAQRFSSLSHESGPDSCRSIHTTKQKPPDQTLYASTKSHWFFRAQGTTAECELTKAQVHQKPPFPPPLINLSLSL